MFSTRMSWWQQKYLDIVSIVPRYPTRHKDCIHLTELDVERDDAFQVLVHWGVVGNAASVSMNLWHKTICQVFSFDGFQQVLSHVM